jgi:hypothetical protein
MDPRVLAPVTGGSAQTPLNSSLSYWTKAQRNLNRGGIPQFPRLNAACYLLNPTENRPSTGSVDCTVDRHGGDPSCGDLKPDLAGTAL